MMTRKYSWIIIVFFLITSCVSKKEEGVIISDATLISMLQPVSSFTYYRNSNDTLDAMSPSPHFFYVRVRFNSKALSVLNDSVSDLNASVFPDESMVVKEVYDERGGALQSYAVMFKMRNAANSGSGWVWSEYGPDGSIRYSAGLNGGNCVSCHSSPTNSDLVKTFGLH